MTFKIGTTVDVEGRKDLTHYGKIIELQEGGQAIVRFRIARRPSVCTRCDVSIMLSLNAGTGEVECMRSGCGYRHGFDERDEIISLDNLINMDEIHVKEAKEAFREKIRAALSDDPVKRAWSRNIESWDSVLSKKKQQQVLNLLDKLLEL